MKYFLIETDDKSEDCIKTVMMYQEDILCKGIKLWDRESGENATYFLTILDELDCISDKTQYNSVGNILRRDVRGIRITEIDVSRNDER